MSIQVDNDQINVESGDRAGEATSEYPMIPSASRDIISNFIEARASYMLLLTDILRTEPLLGADERRDVEQDWGILLGNLLSLPQIPSRGKFSEPCQLEKKKEKDKAAKKEFKKARELGILTLLACFSAANMVFVAFLGNVPGTWEIHDLKVLSFLIFVVVNVAVVLLSASSILPDINIVVVKALRFTTAGALIVVIYYVCFIMLNILIFAAIAAAGLVVTIVVVGVKIWEMKPIG